MTTKADMQNSTKGQSSVSGYKLIVAIDLTICQKLSAFHWSRSANPVCRDHKNERSSIHMFSCTVGDDFNRDSASMREANLRLLRLKRIAERFSSTT
jgi:hypothetical protein